MEAATKVSVKKVFLKISQNLQESTFARAFLHKNAGLPQTCNFFKKEALAQVFSCEFCKVFRNTFFYRTTPVAASVNNTPSALHICFPGKVSQDGSELVVWSCSAK